MYVNWFSFNFQLLKIYGCADVASSVT